MAGSSAASDRRPATLLGVERADWPLTLGGAGLALALSVAAAALSVRGGDRPLINGGEHLAVFAKPARLQGERLQGERMRQAPEPRGEAAAVASVAQPPAASPTPVAAAAGPALDFTPTATIGPVAAAAPPASGPAAPVAAPAPKVSTSGPPAAKPQAAPYALLRATKDRATFSGPNGPLEAKRGDLVPGLGRVQAITWKDGEWNVVLSAPKGR